MNSELLLKISYFINNYEDFLTFIQVSKKCKTVLLFYQNFRIYNINSPFDNIKLFGSNPGAKKNNWSKLFVNSFGEVNNFNNIFQRFPLKVYFNSRNIGGELGTTTNNVKEFIFRSELSPTLLFSNFSYLSKITRIVLPMNMKYILNKCNNCDHLKEIVLPINLIKIENSFNNNPKLSIIKSTFEEDDKNVKNNIPLNVNSIENSFNNLDNLKQVYLNENLENVSYSFNDNIKFTKKIKIPKSLIIIDHSFRNRYISTKLIIAKDSYLSFKKMRQDLIIKKVYK